MDCNEARSKMLASSIDDEVREHVRDCEACAELAADDGRLAQVLGTAPTTEPDRERYQQLIATMRAEDESTRGKLRAMPTYQRVMVAMLAVVITAAVMFVGFLRPDWGSYPMIRMALILGAMVVAAGFAVVLAMPRVYRPKRPRLYRLTLFAILLVIPFIPAMLPAVQELHPAAESPGFLVGLGKCLGLGTLAALPALLVIRALQRDSTLTLWGTLFAALAAGIGANLALQLHCPIVDPMHIAFGHGALGVVYAVLAWIVVRTAVSD